MRFGFAVLLIFASYRHFGMDIYTLYIYIYVYLTDCMHEYNKNLKEIKVFEVVFSGQRLHRSLTGGPVEPTY